MIESLTSADSAAAGAWLQDVVSRLAAGCWDARVGRHLDIRRGAG